jgi:hypothetical protein
MFRSETTDTLMGSGSASFEMKTERFAMAYRLVFGYAFVRPESEQNSSHLQIDCDRGRWWSLQGLKAITDIQGITLRKPPYHYASSPYAGLTARAHSPILMQKIRYS